MTKSICIALNDAMRRAGFTALCLPVLSVLLLLGAVSPAVAQPANDNAAQAEIIAGLSGSVAGSNVAATEEAGEPSHFQLSSIGASIWYRWTAPSNTLVTFDTLGSAGDIDTVMAVYIGGPAYNTMTLVANDDDGAGSLKSRVIFNAVSGQEYYIALDGYDYGEGSQTGSLVLNWAPGAALPLVVGEAGEFNFSAGTYIVTEFETQQSGLADPDLPGIIIGGTRNTPGALITVTRTGGTLGRMLVDYTTINTNIAGTCGDTNSTAGVPNCDYFPTSGTLLFDDFQMSASFIVQVGSDGVDVSGNKRVFLTLSNPRPDPLEEAANPGLLAPVLGARTNSAIVILELNTTDPLNNRSTNFVVERRSYTRTEGGQIRVEVLHPSGSGGSVGVRVRGVNQAGRFPRVQGSDYAVDTILPYPPGVIYTDGTTNFIELADFTPFATTFRFDQGQRRRALVIDLPSTPDVEFNEDILVDLVPISGEPPIGANGLATVTLISNEQPAGSLDRDWNPDLVSYTTPRFNSAPGANNTVRSIAVQQVGLSDERTVIGGDFTAYNSFPRNRIARINPDGSLDESFDPGSGADNFVSAVIAYPRAGDPNSGKVIVAGGFTSMDNKQRNGIARLNSDGSLDESFNPGVGADSVIRSLALQSDGKILIAGEFVTFNGVDRSRVARLNADGSVDMAFDPGLGADGTVWSVAVRDGASTIFVPRSSEGNEFEDRNEIETGSTEGTIEVNYDYLTIPDNIRIYYDGVRIFDVTTNGFGRHRITYGPGNSTKVTIVLNEGTGEPGTLWSYTANVITPIPARKIFIGGEFVHVDGTFAGGVARLDDSGAFDFTYDPGMGVEGVVYTVAPQNDGRLVIGGFFSSVDSRRRQNLARLEFNGAIDTSFDSGTGPDDAVYSVTFQADGKSLVGGLFTSFNGTRRMGLTRLFYNGTVDTSFLDTAYNHFAGFIDPYHFQPPNYVNAIAVESTGNVMVGGSFTQVGGSSAVLVRTRADKRTRYNVARLIGGYTPGPGNIEYRYTQNTIDENAGQLFLAFRRLDGLLGEVAARVTSEDNIAVAPADYASASGEVIWRQSVWAGYPDRFGDTDESYFFISITEDSFVEGDEPFFLGSEDPVGSIDLGGEIIPVGVALGRSVSLATIVDNDFYAGTFNFSSPTYFANENAGFVRVAVVRTNGSSGLVQVKYFTRDANATAGLDYFPTNGTLSFSSGVTTQYVRVDLRDDLLVEVDEAFSIVLTNATSGAMIAGGSNYVIAAVTLFDNDLTAGKANFVSTSFTTNENAGLALITLARLNGISGQLSVSVAATNGSALNGVDYQGFTNTVTWVSGDSTPKTIAVPLIDDLIVDPAETVGLRIFNPSVVGAVGTVSNATLVIADNDFFGSVSFGLSTFDVDERGTNVSITVVRTGGLAETVSVDYRVISDLTFPNPAIDGANFNSTSGTLTFGPGVMATNFSVDILNDTAATAFQELRATMLLTNFVNASEGIFTNAELRILDDESIGDPAGLADTTFDPYAGGDQPIYAMALQPDGRIFAAGDFTTLNRRVRNRVGRLTSSGTLDSSFNPGIGPNNAVRTLAVQPDGRVLIGGFFESVAGTNRNHVARFLADGTLDRFFDPGSGADNPVYSMALLSDDRIVLAGAFVNFNGVPRPGVAVLETNGAVSRSFDPGVGADGTVFTVAVQLDGKILIGGDFLNVDGTSAPRIARLNLDGSVDSTFGVGTGPSGSVRAIAVQPDGRILIGGSFTNVNGTIRGRLARLNVDGSHDTSFLSAVEGGNGDVLAIAVQNDGRIVVAGDFTLFNGVSRGRITRLYRTGKTDPTINFGLGFNGFVSSLEIQSDRRILAAGGFTTYDGRERLGIVRLHGGSIAGPGGVEFLSPEYLASEDSTNALIVVRRVGGTTGDVSVDYQTQDGTAIAGTHYQSASGTLTFAEGETLGTFLIPLLDNGTADGDLLSGIELLEPSLTGGVVLGPQPVATLRIVDDEGGVGFTQSSFGINESVPSLQAVISVRRSGSTNEMVTVNYSTVSGGSATAFVDYIPTNGSVVFAPGQVTRTFSVSILDDNVVDGSKTIFLSLSNPSAGVDLGLSTSTLTIFDNEFSAGQFVFASSGITVAENASAVFITILRTNGTTGIATISYETRDISAVAGLDYTSVSNVVAFADGETFKVVQIPIVDDLFVEDPETFSIRLISPTGGTTVGSVSNMTVFISENDVSQIIAVSSSLDAESIVPANGIIDSNETVTMTFSLRNIGTGDTSTNLIATLLTGNGLTLPSAPQNFGPLIANGLPVARQFSFKAVGSSGDRLVASLQLTESGVTNGIVTFAFTIGGQASRNFTNSAGITIRDNTTALPYPSEITVANQGGTIIGLAVEVSGFAHRYPDDVDLLLVGPAGQRVTLMSDAGGSNPVLPPGIKLTFADSASSSPPDSDPLASGTFKPVNYAGPGQNTADTFPLPAPRPTFVDPFPYTNTALAVFNGTSPNGIWSLYVVDDAGGESGSISNWALRIQTSDPVVLAPASSVADLSIVAVATPSTVVVGSASQYIITVRNQGPAAAVNASVLGQLPASLNVTSGSSTSGTWSRVQSTLTWNIGSLPPGAEAVLPLTISSALPGSYSLSVIASANQTDPAPANNAAVTTVAVIGVPAIEVLRVANSLTLSWAAGSGFKLQVSDSLTSGNWADVGVVPQLIGGKNVVALGVAAGNKFYRLRAP